MSSRLAFGVTVAGLVLAIPAAAPRVAPLVAQSALAQLGLTEARARTFLFDELKSSTDRADRRTPIAVAGHRAFYKLPAAARGPAAAVLFGWAKAYVSSPAFKAAYAQFRRDANPVDTRAQAPAAGQAATQQAEMLAAVEESRKMVAGLPPADRDRALARIKAQEEQIRDPKFLENLQRGLDMQQTEQQAGNAASAKAFDERYPPDLNVLVARRLRMFLEDTADADFAARIIRLTDGPDGMEFVEPAHQVKSATWQLAVLAGADATRAARTAAAAWLKEIEP